MVREKNQQKWEKIITVQKRSGIPQIKWCEENNVNIHNFRYWVGRLNAMKSGATSEPAIWATVTSTIQEVNQADSLIRVSVGNAVIDINESFDSETFEKVINVLMKHV